MSWYVLTDRAVDGKFDGLLLGDWIGLVDKNVCCTTLGFDEGLTIGKYYGTELILLEGYWNFSVTNECSSVNLYFNFLLRKGYLHWPYLMGSRFEVLCKPLNSFLKSLALHCGVQNTYFCVPALVTLVTSNLWLVVAAGILTLLVPTGQEKISTPKTPEIFTNKALTQFYLNLLLFTNHLFP